MALGSRSVGFISLHHSKNIYTTQKAHMFNQLKPERMFKEMINALLIHTWPENNIQGWIYRQTWKNSELNSMLSIFAEVSCRGLVLNCFSNYFCSGFLVFLSWCKCTAPPSGDSEHYTLFFTLSSCLYLRFNPHLNSFLLTLSANILVYHTYLLSYWEK